MSDKEIVATIMCNTCAEQKGTVYGVPLNSGVRQNITEPADLQNVKICPDCGDQLEFNRHG